MITLTDTAGYIWDINDNGSISDGGGADAFDGGVVLSLVNPITLATASFPYCTPVLEDSDREVVLTAASPLLDLQVTRKVYVPSSGSAFARFTEFFTNPGATAITRTVKVYSNLGSDSSTVIRGTSSGDALATTADNWVITDDGTTDSSGDPAVLHYFASDDGLRPTEVTCVAGSGTITYTFELTLNPGETKAITHFVAQGNTLAELTGLISTLSSFPAEMFAGMTGTEIGELQNIPATLNSAVTTTLPDAYYNLVLTGTANISGTGNAHDNHLTGNSGANTLNGLAGNDTLDGGAGVDILKGGIGDDTYILNDADTVTELAGAGTDTVVSTRTAYTLTTNVENLTLAGTGNINGTGNTLANILTGNSGVNTLNGGAGNDTLNGGGGNDTLIGGTGNDTYIYGAGDTITETSTVSTEIDTVRSSVAYILGDNLENLVLTGTAAINGTGNTLDNTLTGNAGNNVLNGGVGDDTMAGGDGDDTYIVNSTGDLVTETSADGGIDLVKSSVTRTLGAYQENLTLLGTAAINGTGNALGNILTGNTAANTLSGGAGDDTLDGGEGNDILIGGTGNDTYFYEVGDTITETSTLSTEIDTVHSAVTYTLAANLENLTLTGTAAINGTGNARDNVIVANAGNNILNGLAGVDTASYATAGAGVIVSLNVATQQNTGGSGLDTLSNFENLTGSNFNDRLTGTAGDNVLIGLAGNDTLLGGGGDDDLDGGAGNDRMVDATGHDSMNGGSGDDVYVVAGTSGSVLIEDSVGIDTMDASSAAAGVTIDLTPGASSNINGRMVTLAAGGTVDASLDVLFLQDCSGSFSDDVATVQTIVPQVVSAITAVQSDSRFGLASFIDKPTGGFGSSGDYVYQTDLAMTNVSAELSTALSALTIGSGDDTPEAQIEALMQAAIRTTEVGFRPGSFRVAVVMTDADYHVAGDFSSAGANNGDAILDGDPPGTGEDYPTVALLRAKLIASGVVPIFAVTSGNETYYNDLVAQLGFGTVVTLAADSSNLVSALNLGIVDITEARIENAIGSDYNDTIIGNGMLNTLTGGAGNDTYYVQDTDDVVVEALSEGTDLVNSSASYTLSANVENLSLTGDANINGTGNALGNIIVGNAGNNVINGGTGADRMLGGRGNDIFYVDNAGDAVIEYSGNGTDTVRSSVNHTLRANVENLILTGTALVGTGNSLVNQLTGNASNNTLSAGLGNDRLSGGEGNDTLTGGGGLDTFIFNTALNASTNVDNVTDFIVADDTITLENAIFTSLSTVGTLAAGNFRLGAAAVDADDYILYNSTTGAVSYDADGSGAGAAIRFATLDTGLALTNAEFKVS